MPDGRDRSRVDPASLLRHEYVGLSFQELLAQPTSALLGVSQSAALLLKDTLGLATVFDLGSSYLFAVARAAAEAADPGSTPAHLGLAPADWLRPGTVFSSLDAISSLPLSDLRALAETGADPADVQMALDVTTIRDFAYWPPRVAAERVVQEAVGANLFTGDIGAQGDDTGADELRPRFGQYPTERVYYQRFAMLHVPPPNDLTELNGPISLGALATAKSPEQPAIAAVLTFSQSWYAQGITLGHLLHCLALAPGEATRVAVVDWSRRALGSTEEQVSQAEALDNSTAHSRAVSEVQSAVAAELQGGGSVATGFAASASQAHAETSSSGLLGAIIGGGSSSDTEQSATSFGVATSTAWSLGNRTVLGRMSQDVSDRTEQHATSVRNRRASAVSEVSEAEHSRASTRIVANYNHMHALTVQYYEVVQIYRTVTQLHRAERVLLIPLALPAFSIDVVDRFKGSLVRAALNDRARDLMLDLKGSVAVLPRTVNSVVDLIRGRVGGDPFIRPFGTPLRRAGGRLATTRTLSARYGGSPWTQGDYLAVAKAISRPLIRDGSDALHLPPDVEVNAITVDGVELRSLQLDQAGASPTVLRASGPGTFQPPTGTTLGDFDAISVIGERDEDSSGSIVLHCVYRGQAFVLPLVVDIKAGPALQRAVALAVEAADRHSELLAHLQANRDYYTTVIARSLGPASIMRLISHYRWNGRPLADQIEPQPLGVVGNYLLLRAPVDAGDPSGVLDGSGAQLTWGDLLAERGLDAGQRDERLVPIPTSGVFAEAVLGRSNSAERLDLTRFWNWQDSPIPLTPTEIVPVDTGSRGASAAPTPGQLAPSVANIVNPTALPDPTGVNAVLNAVANGNIFRDMSGLAGNQQTVQAGQRVTSQAATEAGQLAAANLKTEAQKQVALGQVIGDIAKSALGGGAGGGGKGGAGISGEGARINHGRDMDNRGAGRGNAGSTAGSRGSTPSGTGTPTPAGTTGTRTPTGPVSPVSTGAVPGGTTPATAPLTRTEPAPRSYEVTYSDASALGFSPEAIADTFSPDGAGSPDFAGMPSGTNGSGSGSANSNSGAGPIAELAAEIRSDGGDENALSAVLDGLGGVTELTPVLEGLGALPDLAINDADLFAFPDEEELS